MKAAVSFHPSSCFVLIGPFILPIDAAMLTFLVAVRNFYEKDSQSFHFYFLWETFVIW